MEQIRGPILENAFFFLKQPLLVGERFLYPIQHGSNHLE